ncbi:hypothetical protein LJC20_05165 [Eubacteriales bacterium OttesenSCG-928-M02]|nr:hypothetical protein [Eubacteriales bacterium OttesenSCG-928-M02]
MKISKGFYQAYREEQRQRGKEERERKEPLDQRIVVLETRPASAPRRVLWWLGKGLWGILYLLLFVLSSVGLTALVNESTRNILLALIGL